jgi:hypothetical protein
MISTKLKVYRTRAENVQIQNLLQTSSTFYRVFNEDWTQTIIDDLRNRLYGKIPRNFLVNVGGLIGTPTGIFKSTLGLQLCLKLDPMFNLTQRVAFSVNQLLDKVRDNSEYFFCNNCYMEFKTNYKGTYEEHSVKNEDDKCSVCGDLLADKLILLTKMIFFLDEQTKSLKQGGIIRLQNLADTCRQRQICFVTCGVEQYGMHFTTYNLKRIQESDDSYLPLKRVRYAVYDDDREIYYGFFQWDITPLTDPAWKNIFDEYSKMKTDFQRVAIAQQTQAMNFEDYAQEIIDSPDFSKTFKMLKDGRKVMQTALVRSLIYQKYSDMTEMERNNILSQVKMILMNNNDDDEDA